MPEVRIGCSGFNYTHWKGHFYPEDLPARMWFAYYCRFFTTVELNVTFYRLPKASTYDKWYRETPDGFAFALKGSRFITHTKRLRDPKEPLALFFEGATSLRDKLRIVLWQLPPSFAIDLPRLKSFLRELKKHRIRSTLEFRHESWISDEVVDLCLEHNVSLCMADWPTFLNDLPLTADFVYTRFHGEGGNYATDYSQRFLKGKADRIGHFLGLGKDVYVYFNNDAYGFAPKNAGELLAMVR